MSYLTLALIVINLACVAMVIRQVCKIIGINRAAKRAIEQAVRDPWYQIPGPEKGFSVETSVGIIRVNSLFKGESARVNTETGEVEYKLLDHNISMGTDSFSLDELEQASEMINRSIH